MCSREGRCWWGEWVCPALALGRLRLLAPHRLDGGRHFGPKPLKAWVSVLPGVPRQGEVVGGDVERWLELQDGLRARDEPEARRSGENEVALGDQAVRDRKARDPERDPTKEALLLEQAVHEARAISIGGHQQMIRR